MQVFTIGVCCNEACSLCVCDCSQVDRCHRFSQSILLGGGRYVERNEILSSYVCSAKLSNSLPLWSNARHCAECPPLGNLTTQFDTTAPFGLIDDTAAIYFDFWSERTEKHRNKNDVLFTASQFRHDINGPFSTTCSASRATNAFGHAGQYDFPMRVVIG